MSSVIKEARHVSVQSPLACWKIKLTVGFTDACGADVSFLHLLQGTEFISWNKQKLYELHQTLS